MHAKNFLHRSSPGRNKRFNATREGDLNTCFELVKAGAWEPMLCSWRRVLAALLAALLASTLRAAHAGARHTVCLRAVPGCARFRGGAAPPASDPEGELSDLVETAATPSISGAQQHAFLAAREALHRIRKQGRVPSAHTYHNVLSVCMSSIGRGSATVADARRVVDDMVGDGLIVGAHEMVYVLDCLAEAASTGSRGEAQAEDVNVRVLAELYAEVKSRGLWGEGDGLGFEGVESLLSSSLAVGRLEREKGVDAGSGGSGEEYRRLVIEATREVQRLLWDLPGHDSAAATDVRTCDEGGLPQVAGVDERSARNCGCCSELGVSGWGRDCDTCDQDGVAWQDGLGRETGREADAHECFRLLTLVSCEAVRRGSAGVDLADGVCVSVCLCWCLHVCACASASALASASGSVRGAPDYWPDKVY